MMPATSSNVACFIIGEGRECDKKKKIRDNDNKHFMDTGNFFALVVSNYYQSAAQIALQGGLSDSCVQKTPQK
jgi:hypothetical protein